MKPLLLALPGHEALASALARELGGEEGSLSCERFADGESRVRLDAEAGGRPTILCATLSDPDPQLMPLLLAADAARELGATSVTLVAPYLAYMRQDTRFQPGEAVSARTFGRLLSSSFDALVTVDPHLHRIHSLEEVYSLEGLALHAAPLLSAWIREHVERPLVVGPDAESVQWAAEVAEGAACPHVVLTKVRHDDSNVEVSGAGLEGHAGLTPVLVDDVIATAGTASEAVRHLTEAGLETPVVLAVHGLFVGGAEERLRAAGAERIVTTDSVLHATNAIRLAPLLASGVRGLSCYSS